jgi:sulfatase maturation enzyme AslB (radical SAM superfamily)
MGLAEQLQEAVIQAYGPSDWPIPVFHVMVKPGGPACNMACGYCYYRHNTDAVILSE